MTKAQEGTHLVLYDGVCGLCDGFVQLLLRIDRRGVLRFAQLQGATAARLRRRGLLADDLDSMAFVEGLDSDRPGISFRSTGALRTLASLGGPWRLFSWLCLIPRPVRDLVYDFVARHRYRWFGRFDTCRLPAPESRARFLE